MNFFSPLLLSISSNLDTFRVSNFLAIKKIAITKFQIMIISIITTIFTFFSLYLGLFVKKFLLNEILPLFGCILLILIGFYFLVEYIKLKRKFNGEDTSYYVENTSDFSVLLNEGNLSVFNNSLFLDFKNSVVLALHLSKNNIGFGVLSSLIGINIPICVFFNFIITIFALLLGEYIGKTLISKFVTRYSYLMCSFIVILLGIYSYFQ